MSQGSFSANQDKDEYGPPGGYGGQYSGGYSEAAPSQNGMTTEPSVGRFVERDPSMFSRKPSTPVLPSSNNSMLSQDSTQSSSSAAGGIVNLRAPPRPDGKVLGKMYKNASRKKK